MCDREREGSNRVVMEVSLMQLVIREHAQDLTKYLIIPLLCSPCQ